MEYRHTQIGTTILAGVALSYAALVALASTAEDAHTPLAIASAGLVVVLLLFGSLTVKVGDGRILCRFGVGLIRRSLPLSDVRSARVVANPWYAGWGIRWMPGQYLLWNVAGLRGVELLLAGGRRFRIGTDEPEELLRALRNAGIPDGREVRSTGGGGSSPADREERTQR